VKISTDDHEPFPADSWACFDTADTERKNIEPCRRLAEAAQRCIHAFIDMSVGVYPAAR
jgi:hypothetical protein